jgi:hypothetical protein
MGLYEGESLLYFMIAQSDLDTVKWLLEKKARFHVRQTRIICKAILLSLKNELEDAIKMIYIYFSSNYFPFEL